MIYISLFQTETANHVFCTSDDHHLIAQIEFAYYKVIVISS